MAMAKITVNGYRGDNAGFALTVLQGGAPVDFSGAEVRSELRTEPDSTLLTEWDITVTGNELAFSLLPKETEQLPTTARFDVEVDWSGGDRTQVQTIAVGVVTMPEDITLPQTVT